VIRDRKASEWSARMHGPNAEKHRAAFEEWLRDPRNAAAYARYEDDWNVTRDLAHGDVPKLEKPRSAAHSVPLRWAAAAAAALALVCAWYLQATPRATDLANTEAAASTLRLADGSTVVLMDGAQIEPGFTASERRVTLERGRARFTVAHDARRPFIVRAGNSQTTALGTVFEIDLRGSHPRVHLIEGAIDVRSSSGSEPVRLAPGQSAEVEAGKARRIALPSRARAEQDRANSEHATATTMIEADGLPLRAVIDAANRINRDPIRLADPALGTLAVSGRFELADSAALARKLAAALDLDLASTGEAHILNERRKNQGG
jgi:transmembrane sensor